MQQLREQVRSRELRTPRGVLLLPKGSVLNTETVARLRQFNRTEPFLNGIYVYRDRMANQPKPAIAATASES
ncbi:MAG: hypothetical protein CMJ46_12020 [Planctomyces sp.]|nr:hypothetical protein [Planctomyces sp.]